MSWYGGESRRVELISGGVGHWYKARQGLVPVRWVFVHDIQGTHRDEYFYCTDPTLDPAQIVSLYTARWSIEVTFQEIRAHLGFTTVRALAVTAVCALLDEADDPFAAGFWPHAIATAVCDSIPLATMRTQGTR